MKKNNDRPEIDFPHEYFHSSTPERAATREWAAKGIDGIKLVVRDDPEVSGRKEVLTVIRDNDAFDKYLRRLRLTDINPH